MNSTRLAVILFAASLLTFAQTADKQPSSQRASESANGSGGANATVTSDDVAKASARRKKFEELKRQLEESAESSSARVSPEEAATVAAIKQFHQRMLAGEFDAICSESSSIVKEKQGCSEIVKQLKITQSRFGKCTEVTFSKRNVLPRDPIEIRAVYNMKCEKGESTEMFIYIVEGRSVRLVHFNAAPGAVRPAESPTQN